MFKHILVPVDGSATSMLAVTKAAELAKAFGSEVTAVYVLDPYPFTGVGADFAYGQAQYLSAATAEANKALEDVQKTMADAGVGKRLIRLGLKDTYAHGGSRPYLMRYYGLDAPALVAGIERLTGARFGITDADLDAVRIDAVHSVAKAEAL